LSSLRSHTLLSLYRRRAFEKHFKEPRHSQGMAALGIPNTKAFFEITGIEDAQRLLKSMQERQRGAAAASAGGVKKAAAAAGGGAAADDGEEYEDEEGNVYDKKTYDLLKAQGLI
jgi:splicing factor 3A subunit 3